MVVSGYARDNEHFKVSRADLVVSQWNHATRIISIWPRPLHNYKLIIAMVGSFP